MVDTGDLFLFANGEWMTGSFHMQRVLAIFLWALSIAIPFMEMFFEGMYARTESEENTPVSWLSMPAGLGRTVQPLNYWSMYARYEWDHKEASDVEPATHPEETAVHGPLPSMDPPGRIQIYGLVSEGDRPVYCFYDSNQEHWFRLAVGELDTVSGFHLVENSINAEIHLMEVESGKRFLIHQENWRLTAINGPLSEI